jgi:cytochrome P450
MFTAEFITDPYPTYDHLRSNGPIHWSDDFGRGAWLLPSYADVSAGLRDTRLSSKRSHSLVARLPVEARPEFTEFDHIFALWMLFLDPPRHGRLRRLMNKGFKPEVLRQLRPRIQKTVDALLDKVQAAGRMDFMRDFAHPLPALVIAEMLGVDREDEEKFIAWSDQVALFMGNPKSTVEQARLAQDGLLALTEYFRVLLPERRREPGDDLVSLLIRAEEGGEALTAEELLAQCSMLLFAGHETTRNLLGNGLLALLRHPAQLEMLKEQPSLMYGALKELLRYDSPVQYTVRVAAEPFTLHGREIEVGHELVLLIGSANRDPLKFEAPHALDITREQGLPLSFGYGAHVCIGATTSLLEAEVAFGTLLRRMPNLRLAGGTPSWSPNVAFRGLAGLPVTF